MEGGVREGALIEVSVGADEDVTVEGLEDGIKVSMTLIEINAKMINQYFIWFAHHL